MMTMMNDTERHEAARDVLAERRRQIEAEGWTPEHDDAYAEGDLAQAAGCYSLYAHCSENLDGSPADWPWPDEWWKPAGPRRNLVKAGALILAEIERLDRAALAASTGQGAVPQASAAQFASSGGRDAGTPMPEILYGPSTHVTWTPDHTPKDQRRQVVLVDAEQFTAWQRTQAAEVPEGQQTAMHQRILAASVPAGCKAVPVELLERILPVLDKAAFYKFGDPVTPDSKVANDLRTELLAILAQQGEGVKDE